MKILAFYLPQFHAIPENDKWWGSGFTEWTNIKKSRSYFRGHVQPEIPLYGEYYDLLNDEVQVEQSEVAQKYGIDGFVYYHYWFEGKLLLEKPMENMLNNQQITIPFCVSWANETWSRTWDGQESEILIKQNYNENEESWKNHFEYLLPFFKDDRYLKDNNRPIMIIYKPQFIEKQKEMIDYWNNLAIAEGFDGIYWGYQHYSAYDSNMDHRNFDFGIEFEPFYTVRELKKSQNFDGVISKIMYGVKNPKWFMHKIKRKLFRIPVIYDYDKIWNLIVSRNPERNKLIPGAFTAWDNTPRRKNDSCVFFGSSPEKFNKYLKLQLDRAENIYNSNYLFINAWNEWAEGAHLEPDEINEYKYLEAVRDAKNGLISSKG